MKLISLPLFYIYPIAYVLLLFLFSYYYLFIYINTYIHVIKSSILELSLCSALVLYILYLFLF